MITQGDVPRCYDAHARGKVKAAFQVNPHAEQRLALRALTEVVMNSFHKYRSDR